LHELIFGKSARIPTSDSVLASDLSETYVNYPTSLFNRFRDSRELASDNLNRTKQIVKHDTKSRAFKRGEVYLLKEPVKGKLADQYIGSRKGSEDFR